MTDLKALAQHSLERLSEVVKNILHPSFYERTLLDVGVSLGREVVDHVRQSRATAPQLKQEDYLRCLQWMKTHGEWNHEVKVATKGLISVSIPHCPFGRLAADNPYLCQVEAGMLGGIAGDHFNYAKVEICRGPDVPPKDCSLIVHLERTPQSMIVEGPSFPLAPAGAKQAERVSPEARMVAQLSPREQQIVRLIGEGLSDKEIAKALRLSVRTVEGHVARIRNKTGLGGRGTLIRLALRSNVFL
ncbi:MAG: hypothetical protein KF722_17295 [Nitrospira sp.]|nr:hypothetical protein [Nitrospira sp.]